MSVLLVGLVGACASFQPPTNVEAVRLGDAYQAQYRDPAPIGTAVPFLRSEAMNAARCLPLAAGAGGNDGKGGGLDILGVSGEALSPGDLVDIRVADDDTFTGTYEVSRDGRLRLPFLDPIRASGRSTSEVEADIAQNLLAEELYTSAPRLSVRVTDFAGVRVGVSGAVFEPRSMQIGGPSGNFVDEARQSALGATTETRNLSAAIRSAGGIRPDADISAVQLYRGGRMYTLDLRGVFEGRNVNDVMLLSDDEVVVPSRQCFQEDLMRPSPISPPGVSLYLSNLTQPAASNASAAIGREVREVPWGTRYMQAVIDANCVGGARTTSADRSALLFSRNPVNGLSVVIERDIGMLLRRGDRDDYDPYLLPGDSIACYDSAITSIAEIGRVLGIVGAVALFN